MIAEVIVDVPAQQTDRPFDYRVPDKWAGMIQEGMRVTVPFGPRKLLGFVVRLKETSEFKALKSISGLLDIEPALNKELLELGHWLADETMCFKISAFQAMLPAAMKAKYEKQVRLSRDMSAADLLPELQSAFQKTGTVKWDDVQNDALLPLIKAEMDRGVLELSIKVSNKGNVKKEKYIKPLLDRDGLINQLNATAKTAKNQRLVLNYFLENNEEVSLSKVLKETGLSGYSALKPLVNKGVLHMEERESYRDHYDQQEFEADATLPLTEEQRGAMGPIERAVAEKRNETFLLYGVTGSGKTEIYLQSIKRIVDQGKEAIVLVPEISLTPMMVTRFKRRFGNLVAVLHSGLSTGEKYDEWRKIQRGEVKVVVGARSAVFAPFTNIGLIIIDEEHEGSYKQEETPRYHSRDVALKRAGHHHCPVILGSATPSLETFARAKKGVYTLLTLKSRVNQRALPEVSIVDMRDEMRGGNRSMFSELLFEKLKERVEKGEQSVLMLNRRGHSSFVMCRNCGLVVTCPNCDVSMTFHRVQSLMKCHYCGLEERVPDVCPDCGSDHIRYFGTGTQKVEEELGKLMPHARVIRMDVDTTSRKGAHEALLKKFEDGQADILLGTQMIAKGLDFPKVTLVGVLSADTMLHLPDFRASERTFQLLTQVSGRAGRHELPGEVVIQTYTPEHYSIQLAAEQDYEGFFMREMFLRKQNDYPPYYYIALLTVSHEDVLKAMDTADKITTFIKRNVGPHTVVFGPSASPMSRINNRYRYQCLIKYKREPKLTEILKTLNETYGRNAAQSGLQLSIDVNPFIMM
ncbi:primosomal protein N' [Gracilibacillus sp. Marseille-QA3620]